MKRVCMMLMVLALVVNAEVPCDVNGGLDRDFRARRSADGPLRRVGEGDCVVLLHGLGRSTASMKYLEWALEREGYRVINLGYPARRLTVSQCVEHVARSLSREHLQRAGKVHFVTHSLGGIVLRQLLREHPLENLGRVVMLAPPNQGSEVADKLRKRALFRWGTGPAGQELGSGGKATAKPSAVDFDLGVIAGDRSLNPLFSRWLTGPDDGKVSVRSTKIEGMKDFLVVHHTHTWMMWRKAVIMATLRFLATGSFAEKTPTSCLLRQAAGNESSDGQGRASRQSTGEAPTG